MEVAELIKIATVGFDAFERFMANYRTVRAVASTEDQVLLDKAYHDFTERSNAVADRLRATPDDKV